MKTVGRFYFKRTSNGNLIGEWSNNDANQPRTFTESSDLICGRLDFTETVKDTCTAEYDSTWQEKGKSIYARLKISRSNPLFLLEWFDSNGKPVFKGNGMLCDDILIGDYHSVP